MKTTWLPPTVIEDRRIAALHAEGFRGCRAKGAGVAAVEADPAAVDARPRRRLNRARASSSPCETRRRFPAGSSPHGTPSACEGFFAEAVRRPVNLAEKVRGGFSRQRLRRSGARPVPSGRNGAVPAGRRVELSQSKSMIAPRSLAGTSGSKIFTALLRPRGANLCHMWRPRGTLTQHL